MKVSSNILYHIESCYHLYKVQSPHKLIAVASYYIIIKHTQYVNPMHAAHCYTQAQSCSY